MQKLDQEENCLQFQEPDHEADVRAGDGGNQPTTCPLRHGKRARRRTWISLAPIGSDSVGELNSR
jgi:hypothetical protein